MLTRKVLFVVASLGLLNCGGGGGEGGGSIEPSQIGSELGGATCERMFECCTADELMAELGGFDIETEQECTMFFAGFVGGFLQPQIEASVEAGRMIYHGDRMADCVAVIRALPCDELAAAMTDDLIATGCENPFEGLVADGDACANDMECTSGTCVGDSMDFEGNVTEGTCGTSPGIGETCDFDGCADGAYCSFGGSEPTCEATQPAGSACSGDDECDSDNCADGICSDELRCDGA